jgi:hypothetical protein
MTTPSSPPFATGLRRTTLALAGHELQIPSGILVFIGRTPGTEALFAVKPTINRNNAWFWEDPVIPIDPIRDGVWIRSLIQLPGEGYYTLPETLKLGDGGQWLDNAIVQLGYNHKGEGILFVAERREGVSENALYFSDGGLIVSDALLARLRWAPILPVPAPPPPSGHPSN